MSNYKVIHYFEDLQDFSHPYKVGDIFPRLGLKVSQERLDELSSNKNRQKKPLIQKIEDEKDFVIDGKVVGQIEDDVIVITDEELVKKNTYTKTDINRMSTAELKELASANDIKDSNKMTGSELKKILIEYFNL